MKTCTVRNHRIALVIPAHNEELVIEATIKSAIAAGQPKRHIYVVNDSSTDSTLALASRLLGPDHVVTVRRSGKAQAIKKAVRHFGLTKSYRWIHIADADGIFGPDYFLLFKSWLDPKRYVAATGHVQSLKGDWISRYRTYEYTLGLEIMRRYQAWFGIITVIPGATSCFRSDIFNQLEFNTHSLTEDFDLTLQIHRRRLGRIRYIPQAKTLTQDPKDYHDYTNQVQRWSRGFFQGLRRHRVGLHAQKIDAYLSYIVAETIFYLFQLLFIPVLLFTHPAYLAVAFVVDIIIFLTLVTFAALVNRRWDILLPFPLYYILRFTNLYLFAKAFIEIMLLRRFKTIPVGWATEGRRYRLTALANK